MLADEPRYGQNKIYGSKRRKVLDCMLVAHIPMNGTFEDIKGTNCGTCTGALTFAKSPLLNGAVYTCLGDRVALANECNFDFEITDPFSITAWINPTVTTDIVSTIVGKQCGLTCTGWQLGICRGLRKLRARWVSGISNTIITANCTITFDGKHWQHVGMTYEGDMCRDGVNLYIDGALAVTGTTNVMFGSHLNNCALTIGANTSGSACSRFLGGMSDVRIWDDELTAAQIACVYGQGKARAARLDAIDDTSLLLNIELNGCVCCQAGNTNHGTWFLGGCPCPAGETYTKGIFNKSGCFGGTMCTARTVGIDNECNFDFTGSTAFSISIWAKRAVNGFKGRVMVGKGADLTPFTNPGWNLFEPSFGGTERLSFSMVTVCFSGTTFNVCCTGFGEDHYTHVVFTKAANTTVACSHFYINNVKTTGPAGTYPNGTTNNLQVGIGTNGAGGVKFNWCGQLTCAMIWDRQITDSEVTRLFEQR